MISYLTLNKSKAAHTCVYNFNMSKFRKKIATRREKREKPDEMKNQKLK